MSSTLVAPSNHLHPGPAHLEPADPTTHARPTDTHPDPGHADSGHADSGHAHLGHAYPRHADLDHGHSCDADPEHRYLDHVHAGDADPEHAHLDHAHPVHAHPADVQATRPLKPAATRRPNRLRTRTERGAATAEYAVTIVAACGIAGVLVALLRSPAMTNALKAIINYALKIAGVEGVHL